MIKAPDIIHRLKKQGKESIVNNEEIIDIPMPIVEAKDQVVGNFPALASKLQDELNVYLSRQKAAITKVLEVTREKTEFLEAVADKTEEEVKNEKRTIARSLGNI